MTGPVRPPDGAPPAFWAATDPTHIEFFGLPGSGKTTLARRLLAEVVARHPSGAMFGPHLVPDGTALPARILAKSWLILAEAPHVGGPCLRAWRDARMRQPTPLDTLRTFVTLATVMSLYSRIERRGQPAMIDQGYLQAIWSIRLRGTGDAGSGGGAALLRRAAATSRIHVVLEADPATCIARLTGRASRHSRLQQPDRIHDRGRWDDARSLQVSIVEDLAHEYARLAKPARIVNVDATWAPKMAVEHVLAAITSIQAGQGSDHAV